MPCINGRNERKGKWTKTEPKSTWKITSGEVGACHKQKGTECGAKSLEIITKQFVPGWSLPTMPCPLQPALIIHPFTSARHKGHHRNTPCSASAASPNIKHIQRTGLVTHTSSLHHSWARHTPLGERSVCTGVVSAGAASLPLGQYGTGRAGQ